MPIKLKHCAGPCDTEKLIVEFWKDSKQPDGRQAKCIACVKEARRQREERRRNGETLPAVTEEERGRRSERAKALHAEGRFGGKEFGERGGRPKKPRLADALLEHFREQTPLIIRAVESNLRSKNKSQRMRAAEYLTGLENQEEKRIRDNQGAGKRPEDMTADELREFVAAGIAAQIERGEFDTTGLADITLDEDDVVEIASSAA